MSTLDYLHDMHVKHRTADVPQQRRRLSSIREAWAAQARAGPISGGQLMLMLFLNFGGVGSCPSALELAS